MTFQEILSEAYRLTNLIQSGLVVGKEMSAKDAAAFMTKNYPDVTTKRATDEEHNYLVAGKIVGSYNVLDGVLYLTKNR